MTTTHLLPPHAEEVINLLKEDLRLKKNYERIWRQKIIEEVAQARNLTVTSEEIQEEAEQQRRKQRLEKADDTLKWLADHRVTEDEWEAGIQKYLLSQKLAKALFDDQVEKHFAQNKMSFERLLLYQIGVEDRKVAQELFYQIEEKEISFYEAAHLYDIDENRRNRCGFEGKIYRKHLKPDIAAAVFGAPLKEVIGPLEIEKKHYLFFAEEFIPAELTSERYQEIIFKLFEEWLNGELNYRLNCT
ncbi:MAG: peptidylprolyl isomerase [Leptolyngbyaceae cyanobacterium]